MARNLLLTYLRVRELRIKITVFSLVFLRFNTRSVRKVSSHSEYLENRSRGLDVTWQPVRGDLTAQP